VVLNYATYTVVDNAKEEKYLYYLVNIIGINYVVKVCKDINSNLDKQNMKENWACKELI
jgi:dTDP-4-dehydrorhamnose reductase